LQVALLHHSHGNGHYHAHFAPRGYHSWLKDLLILLLAIYNCLIIKIDIPGNLINGSHRNVGTFNELLRCFQFNRFQRDTLLQQASK